MNEVPWASGCAGRQSGRYKAPIVRQANNGAHGEGDPAPTQARQLEAQVVELQSQLRATQAQVQGQTASSVQPICRSEGQPRDEQLAACLTILLISRQA